MTLRVRRMSPSFLMSASNPTCLASLAAAHFSELRGKAGIQLGSGESGAARRAP
jgi:hypothetical protein